jgi:hypothetical protein
MATNSQRAAKGWGMEEDRRSDELIRRNHQLLAEVSRIRLEMTERAEARTTKQSANTSSTDRRPTAQRSVPRKLGQTLMPRDPNELGK